ncbi:MAG: benzoate/H(+) symporter BenE family transporter [Neisseria sp.]|nr:benzoate/H(+) symporter BenE family transporter [Neisseria sp.]
MRKDWSFSAITAGFLAVLVSYAGPMVLVFQAAQAAGVPLDITVTWVWAISLGAAVTSIALSWFTKIPVVTAWSAPGTALLITLFPGLSLAEMAGAYITAAALILLIGISGYFDKLMNLIPRGVAAGMMAGILFQFGTQAFGAVKQAPLLMWLMLAAFLLTKKWLPRYSMAVVFAVGLAVTAMAGQLDLSAVSLHITRPVWITPEWTLASTLSLALPLTLVSLTGQFLPGMSILRLSGYRIPARPIIVVTALASLAVAGFGGITIVLAAITAALCTGQDAHADPGKRYIAGISNGVFYLLGALFAGSIVTLFTVLPQALVAILAGLALIGAIGANLTQAMQDSDNREAAVTSFLATASGMAFWGLGAAFWGVVIGMITAWLLKPKAV